MMKPKRIGTRVWGTFSLFFFFAIASQVAGQEKAAPLLVVISVDGLRPDYVTAADAHGAKIPHLRKFLREGSYALGVTGVIPTVTYPSHTTLMDDLRTAKP